MTDQAERKILDMVEQGQITAEEGLRLINAMGRDHHLASNQTASSEFSPVQSQISGEDSFEPTGPAIPEEEMQRMKRLKRWWVLPFGIGLVITTLGAIWMYMGYTANGFGFGFWLSWIPFLLGIAIVGLSFQTSKSVWLHVRIKQKPGESPQRINISLPLPLSLTRWFFSTFGKKIPGLKDQPVGDYSEILKNLSPEEPFYVHVDEDDGEEVEVFIG
jgi:hypothetical protein